MNENTAEKLQVEAETEAPELEVEVVDDTPEEDKNRPARTEGTKPDIPEDDEISSYKGDVQKRIKTLKYEYHEERRKKEAAEREKEEAVKHAERILQENNKLRKTLDDGEAVLVEQVKGKASAMIEAAKKEFARNSKFDQNFVGNISKIEDWLFLVTQYKSYIEKSKIAITESIYSLIVMVQI